MRERKAADSRMHMAHKAAKEAALMCVRASSENEQISRVQSIHVHALNRTAVFCVLTDKRKGCERVVCVNNFCLTSVKSASSSRVSANTLECDAPVTKRPISPLRRARRHYLSSNTWGAYVLIQYMCAFLSQLHICVTALVMIPKIQRDRYCFLV